MSFVLIKRKALMYFLFPDMLHLSFANFGLKKKKKQSKTKPISHKFSFFFLQILTGNLFCFVFLLMLGGYSDKPQCIRCNGKFWLRYSLLIISLLIIPPLTRAQQFTRIKKKIEYTRIFLFMKYPIVIIRLAYVDIMFVVNK